MSVASSRTDIDHSLGRLSSHKLDKIIAEAAREDSDLPPPVPKQRRNNIPGFVRILSLKAAWRLAEKLAEKELATRTASLDLYLDKLLDAPPVPATVVAEAPAEPVPVEPEAVATEVSAEEPDIAVNLVKLSRNRRPDVTARKQRRSNAEVIIARHLGILADIEAHPERVSDVKVARHLAQFDRLIDKLKRQKAKTASTRKLQAMLDHLTNGMADARYRHLKRLLGNHVVVPNHRCESYRLAIKAA